MKNTLLVAGLLFPVLSWITLIITSIENRKTQKSVSGIYIPVIGPILIDIWIIIEEMPLWALIIPWALDIGTLAFLWVLPRLAAELWQTSRFTRITRFVGSKENQTVVISLHRGGHYLLKKQWQRPAGECGILGLSEPGTFKCEGDVILLTSHDGRKRNIRKQNGEFQIVDNESTGDYRLNGWSLKQQSPSSITTPVS